MTIRQNTGTMYTVLVKKKFSLTARKRQVVNFLFRGETESEKDRTERNFAVFGGEIFLAFLHEKDHCCLKMNR